MDFVAVDVETANANLASICQVGLASFRGGELVESWMSFVNPDDYFSSVNTSIHGIDDRCVKDSPAWREVLPQIASRLNGNIAVSHTPFDRMAFSRACERSGLSECECRWLDSARVVRRTWPQFSKSGYGLSNVAECFGIAYQAHDALEDARCAGLLLLRAIAETGLTAEDWLIRAIQPIDLRTHSCSGRGVYREGHPDDELSGEVLVFTGSLSMPRHIAADAAASVGCRVDESITKHTTMLIVGDQDLGRLAGHEMNSKHRKAEQLIAKGRRIRILGESDFARIVSKANSSPMGS